MNEEEGKGNGEQTNTSSESAPSESTDSAEKHEQEEQISKHVIKTENDEVPSIANENKAQSKFVENSLESGAVTAPEAEHQPNKHEFVEDESMHTGMNMNSYTKTSFSE